MSLIASIVTSKEIILLSDGQTIDFGGLEISEDMVVPEDRIVSTTTPKIAKINDRVGLSWVGVWIEYKDEFIRQLNKQGSVSEIASQLADIIRDKLAGQEYLINEDWFMVNVSINGYNQTGPVSCHVVTKNGRVQVSGPNPLIPGMIGCLIPFNDQAREEFKKILLDHGTRTGNEIQTAVRAFKELVNNYSHKGMAGGQIFTEVLSNPVTNR